MSEKGRMIVQEKTKVKCRIYPRNREFQIIPVIMRLFHCFYVVLIRGILQIKPEMEGQAGHISAILSV